MATALARCASIAAVSRDCLQESPTGLRHLQPGRELCAVPEDHGVHGGLAGAASDARGITNCRLPCGVPDQDPLRRSSCYLQPSACCVSVKEEGLWNVG